MALIVFPVGSLAPDSVFDPQAAIKTAATIASTIPITDFFISRSSASQRVSHRERAHDTRTRKSTLQIIRAAKRHTSGFWKLDQECEMTNIRGIRPYGWCVRISTMPQQ